jgi:hypothetical protein
MGILVSKGRADCQIEDQDERGQEENVSKRYVGNELESRNGDAWKPGGKETDLKWANEHPTERVDACEQRVKKR